MEINNTVTPQPHYLPGYTGHVPVLRFRPGKTYGKLTHKLFVDPCVNHAPELLLPRTGQQKFMMDSPLPEEISTVQDREYLIDAVYHYPFMPGYAGFLPFQPEHFGKRYNAAATGGLSDFQTLMDIYRCERRALEHQDLLKSGVGRFEPKVEERLAPMTMYRSPLTAVKNRGQAVDIQDCSYKEKPEIYTKFTVPHYMECDNEEKYIKRGYAGHIPMIQSRYGEVSKEMTKAGLCEYLKRFRRADNWCPPDHAEKSSLCPYKGHFVLYHQQIGMLPNYAGHVPGEHYTFGRTYGNSTVDAKRWLALNKEAELMRE